MKSLHTLLRVAKREMDRLRRMLSAAGVRLADVEARLVAHDAAVIKEQALALRDPQSARAYAAYVLLAGQQRSALLAERVSTEREIEELRALVTAAHVEARKFERLLELEAEREKARREKREDAALDEMATLRAGRR